MTEKTKYEPEFDNFNEDECETCEGEEGPANVCGECGGGIECADCGRNLDPESEPCYC